MENSRIAAYGKTQQLLDAAAKSLVQGEDASRAVMEAVDAIVNATVAEVAAQIRLDNKRPLT